VTVEGDHPEAVPQGAVGEGVPQLDVKEKLSGTAVYTDDLVMPGMLYGKVLRSPFPHAMVRGIDTSKAKRVPGVRAVITFRDVPPVRFNSFAASVTADLPEDESILTDHCRYVGDKVAAVVAEDEAAAEEAISLIKVDWDQLPFVLDPEDSLNPGSPRLHDQGNLVERVVFSGGDIEEGFKTADHIFENVYRSSRAQPCPIEPHCCIAWYSPAGSVTIWSATQTPFRIRRVLAKVLGLPVGDVRIIKPVVGGGFGNKNELHYEHIGALLSKMTGRPVKFRSTREEVFHASSRRHSVTASLKTGVTKDGRIVARQGRFIVDTGAYATHGPEVTRMLGTMWASLYPAPHWSFEGLCVYTNTTIAGAFRGYGNPQGHWAMESQMDEIAEALGMDPIELRLKNHIRLGEIQPVTEYPIQSIGLDECISRGAEAIGWANRGAPSEKSGRIRRGIGMAALMHFTGVKPFVHEVGTAIVRLNEDGTVALLTGAADVGQGSNTVLAQIVATELGIPLAWVKVQAADTATTPYAVGTRGSCVTHNEGKPAQLAAMAVKAKIIERAATMTGISPTGLSLEAGRIMNVASGETLLTIRDVAENSHFGENPAPITGEATFNPPTMAPSFGAQFAEVEVDTETGQVSVKKMVAIHDIGRAINPLSCEGQIQGALQQGMGYALTEGLTFSRNTGQPLNPSFLDYKILSAADMPAIEVGLVESYEPTGPFGAKGLGESGLVPTAPALANAIANAVGVRCRELPMTSERLWVLLKEREQR
jgi:xanthine dehydrogenase molybdenum-binding subunit